MPQYKKVFDVGTYAGVSGFTRVGIPTLRTPGSGGKQVAKSLRFRAANSAYLNRTPSAGNRKTWTWSAWIKRGTTGTLQMVFICDNGTTDATFGSINFQNTDTFNFGAYNQAWRTTTQVFRDPSAWNHFVVAFDTTQATASNRVKVYVNGVQVTSFGASNDPALNTDYGINQAVVHNFAKTYASYGYFDGYMADVNFIDGSALDPTSFGEYNSDNIWVPKAYSGSYGTNGFYLDFNDTSSVAALGYDAAGSNDWTVNGISLTAGTTYDSMYDSPTDYDNSVYGAGNYAVLNPQDKDASAALASANLNISSSAAVGNATYRASRSSLAVSSGLWYAEFTLTQPSTSNAFSFGISPTTDSINGVNYYFGSSSGSYGFAYNGANQNKYNNGSGTQLAAGAPSNGDYFQIAVDLTNGKIWFGKNNTWYEGNPSTGATPSFTFTPSGSYAIGGSVNATATATDQLDANFGQRTFSGTVPTGFKALNTKNITRPTDANMWFYGDTPDLMWIKNRTATADHSLTDTVRGVGLGLSSSSTAVEQGAQDVAEMNKFGMTLIGASSRTTAASNSFVYWVWKAGGTGVSNTSGSITSTVSANTSAGFSVVTYTGNQTAGATVGHGLGVAPSFIFVKCRGLATSWPVYHSAIGATNWLLLNGNQAQTTTSQEWNNTAPTSTVFSLGSSVSNSNQSSTYVAYCFAPVAGYSAFGSWQNNNSTDGSFIYLGFRPRAILLKNSDNVENWYFIDTSRNTYNVAPAGGNWLQPNTSASETTAATNVTTAAIDILSNGFKIRTTSPSTGEVSFGTRSYIYAAFAEFPFKIARAR